MNIKFFIIALVILLKSYSGSHEFDSHEYGSHECTAPIVSEKKVDSITYTLGEDSLYYEEVNGKPVHVMFVDSVPKRLDTLPLSLENYLDVCDFYSITDPEIVYAQSCLESGHFKSDCFKKRNNHLGIMRGNDYATYDNWVACLKDYSNRVAYKKKEGEDHYAFLARIGYAEDENYVSKVKSVVCSNRKWHKVIWESRE